MLGVIAALPAEAKCLTGKGGALQKLTGKNMLLAISGIGPEAAAKAASGLVSKGATALVSWGCAGALSASLAAGDLLLPRTVVAEDGYLFHTDTTWRDRLILSLPASLQWHEAMLAESFAIVQGKEEKRVLAQHSGAVAVDMESAAVGRMARQADIPFIVIRTVADVADESLPVCIAAAMDNNRHIVWMRLLPTLIRQPGIWLQLIRLGWHAHSAMRTLSMVSAQTDRLTNPDYSWMPRPKENAQL